jgi:hypothetical protein
MICEWRFGFKNMCQCQTCLEAALLVDQPFVGVVGLPKCQVFEAATNIAQQLGVGRAQQTDQALDAACKS